MRYHWRSWLRWSLAVIVLVSMVPSFDAAKAQDAVATPIDLQIDNDNDGLPDELVAEVLKIRDAAESVGAASADQQFSTLQQAMSNLFDRLPYSVQTRSVQARLADLQNELLTVEDPALRMNLLNEVDEINAQMMEDPAFVTTLQVLDVLINEQKIDSPRYSSIVYLPMVDTSSTENSIAASEAQGIEQDKLQKMRLSENVSASAVDALQWPYLAKGDTLFIRGSWWNSLQNRIIYCMRFCHAGTYNGNGYVYEANPSGTTTSGTSKSGVRLLPLRDWQAKGAYVGLAFTRYTTYAQDLQALAWAKGKWKTNGVTGYNTNFVDKWTDAKLYCSQLVWKQLRYNGKEADSNNWAYLMWVYAKWGYVGYYVSWYAVTPDEVALDNDIAIWSTGYNP